MKYPPGLSERSLLRRAFTLMEVLVVIVILTILLALVTNVVKRLLVQAGIEKTKTTMNVVMKALDRYYDAKKAYPPDLYTLLSEDSCKELLSTGSAIDSNGFAYDGFDQKISYSPTGGPGKRPKLTSNGPDQLPSTKDDISVP